jgi:hypothetical protein
MEEKNILKEKFEEIKNMGWVKSIGYSYGGVGKTFEQLIGKEIDNFEIPDFGRIEIKSQHSCIKEYISLFSYAPESNWIFEIKRIHSLYAYPDSNDKSIKTLNRAICVNRKTMVGDNYKFMLKIDNINRKIYLVVFDSQDNIIENESYWSFDTIEEKLLRKMKYLAYIIADRRYINHAEYFKYNQIDFYQLGNFETFLELMNKGLIRICFRIGVFKGNYRNGEIHDHGTIFQLKKEALELLFEKW